MSLTPEKIERIANLARLELQPAEAAATLDKMNGFFQLVEAMQSVNTQGVVPLAHPIEVVQALSPALLAELAVAQWMPTSPLSPMGAQQITEYNTEFH